MYILIGISVISVTVAIVLGVMLSTRPGSTSAPTFGIWVELIQSRSPTTSFVNPTSAQSQALEWMLSDPYTLNLEENGRLVQQFALVTLWYSMNGATWSTDDTTDSVGWLSSVHECDRDKLGDGIRDLICDSDKEVILMTLHCRYNLLSGNLPAELGLLSQLEQLEVHNTTLSGTIPTELALLTGLSRLDLSANTLSGSIPTEVGLMTRLTLLSLSANTLTGSIPTELGLLTELSNLDPYDNTLIGSIPTEFGLLTGLQVKLTASDAKIFNFFGSSVVISDNTAVIGAHGDDDRKGSAYVFAMNITSGDWEEFAKLTASDAVQGDEFGSSVAISGNTAVFGAHGNDDFKGSAYVFTMNITTGDWEEFAKLTASDAALDDDLGWSVAISDNTAIIGARRSDDARRGSAYVFTMNIATGD